VEILGMNEAVEIAKQRIGSNMVISAQLVVDMAERANHADALAEALNAILDLAERLAVVAEFGLS